MSKMLNTKNEAHLEVDPRSETGSNACRQLRAAGRVPGNVYGLELAPFAVALNPKRIEELLRLDTGRNTLVTLVLSGQEQKRQVMIREMQRDPLTERIVHIDFVRVDTAKPVLVKVPVRLLGTPTGVKNEGGILDFVHREVQVRCLPTAIPEHLDCDVAELHLNQHVSVKDAQVPEGVTIEEDPEMILAVVAQSRAEVAAPTEEEEPEAAAEGKEAKEAKEGKEAEDAPKSGEESK